MAERLVISRSAPMTDDEAVEAIRVVCFESPGESLAEWRSQVKAILAIYRQVDADAIEELREVANRLQAGADRSYDRLWHGRWMKAHDHDACADDDECAEGFDSWLASDVYGAARAVLQ